MENEKIINGPKKKKLIKEKKEKVISNNGSKAIKLKRKENKIYLNYYYNNKIYIIKKLLKNYKKNFKYII